MKTVACLVAQYFNHTVFQIFVCIYVLFYKDKLHSVLRQKKYTQYLDLELKLK